MVSTTDADLEYPVEVVDYKITMRKHGLVAAAVKMKINGGEEVVSLEQGVGPMDAVLAAMKAETDSFLALQILNHEVEILSPDTDSLVIVTLTLEKEGHEFVAKAASPDTLEALIQAFVNGLAIANKALAV